MGGAAGRRRQQRSSCTAIRYAGRARCRQIISSSGTYTGLNLSDTLTITASNVTIRDSYISTVGGYNVINAIGIQNVVIEDCEIVGGGAAGGAAGQNGVFINNDIGSGGIIVRRNNIHAVGSGVASGDAPYKSRITTSMISTEPRRRISTAFRTMVTPIMTVSRSSFSTT
jgi:hypothetical protein